jgi:low affinity Fe/Cu permease
MKYWNKLNIYIALKLAQILSSMNFFWICLALIAIAIIIPAVAPECSFIAQTVIQLLALPVLGLAQDIQSTRIEKKIDQEMAILKEELKMIKRTHNEILGILKNEKETSLAK